MSVEIVHLTPPMKLVRATEGDLWDADYSCTIQCAPLIITGYGETIEAAHADACRVATTLMKTPIYGHGSWSKIKGWELDRDRVGWSYPPERDGAFHRPPL